MRKVVIDVERREIFFVGRGLEGILQGCGSLAARLLACGPRDARVVK